MRIPLWRYLALPYVLLCLACLAPAAEEAEELEYKVKAAYIYKFTSYIEWPDSAFPSREAPLTIGVLGAEPIASELERMLAGRTANNRAIVLKRLKPGSPLTGIQMLFVGKSEAGGLKALLEQVQSKPVLVVTESSSALAVGSIINFILYDQRIRFEIALGNAEHSGLKLSARLLAVAQQVRNGAP